MKIPKDFFLVKVDKAYDDTVEVNGVELSLDIKWDPYKFARQYGVVQETPGWLPKGLKFDVKKGDKIYFHHLVTGSVGAVTVDQKFESESAQDFKSQNLITWIDEENIYKVHWQQIYARVRKGKLKMLHHWNFVKQKTEDEESIKTKSGIFIKPEVEDITLHGNILHMNEWMKEQGVKVGDEIVFSENSEYEMTIEGEKMLRMRNEDILGLIENERK
tara:strand:+ start:4432 stop:5082 length:651 start_codon:yes stop_codon:yes gene_type:complete